VEWTIKLGLALGCEIAPRALFHRKNYFYRDLPKGYQISQYDEPLCREGRFVVPGAGSDLEVGIVRAHLEEDAAKSVHVGGAGGRSVRAEYSLVDHNRGGAADGAVRARGGGRPADVRLRRGHRPADPAPREGGGRRLPLLPGAGPRAARAAARARGAAARGSTGGARRPRAPPRVRGRLRARDRPRGERARRSLRAASLGRRARA